MNLRKSIYELTDQEKYDFVSAVLRLKYTPSPASGRTYDTYVKWHQESMFPPRDGFYSYAHGCTGFLPWHRQFMRLFELDLQAVSGNTAIAIPYWDWARDHTLTDLRKSPIWQNDFLGPEGDPNDDWRVPTGPFSYKNGRWPLNVRTPKDEAPPEGWDGRLEVDEDLRRQFGHFFGDYAYLPTLDQVRKVLSLERFDLPPFGKFPEGSESFRNELERVLHNHVHVWVGWSMLPMTSPNDPCFFLHHCNVDRIWAKWQDLHRGTTYAPVYSHPTVPGQAIEDLMPPFEVAVKETLDFRAMGYRYDGKASDDAELTFQSFNLTEPSKVEIRGAGQVFL